MRNLLALSLAIAALLTISTVPTALANHGVCPHAAACVGMGSTADGECGAASGDASGFNGAGFSSRSAAYVSGGAHTSCYHAPGAPYYGSGNSLGGGLCVATDATGMGCTWWAWYQNTNAGGHSCHTNVYYAGAGLPWTVHALGCPAGDPPRIEGGLLP